jgi:hypothetical protein
LSFLRRKGENVGQKNPRETFRDSQMITFECAVELAASAIRTEVDSRRFCLAVLD